MTGPGPGPGPDYPRRWYAADRDAALGRLDGLRAELELLFAPLPRHWYAASRAFAAARDALADLADVLLDEDVTDPTDPTDHEEAP